MLERFKAEGAGALGAESAEAFLRKMTAETLSRVVMMRDLIHERRRFAALSADRGARRPQDPSL